MFHSILSIFLEYLQRFRMLEQRKIWWSILLGLLGFGGTFLSIHLKLGNLDLTIDWSLFFPLFIALAWGSYYGIVSVIAGLVFIFPFFQMPNEGWANIYNSFQIIMWITWHGYFSNIRRRDPSLWNDAILAQIYYSALYVILQLSIYPILYGINPPFWNSFASPYFTFNIAVAVTLKGLFLQFLYINFCDTTLLFPRVRHLFGLHDDASSKFNPRIVMLSVFIGSVIMIYFIFVEYFIFGGMKASTPGSVNPYVHIGILIGLTCVLAGNLLTKILESRMYSESLLRQSEKRFRVIFEQAGLGIALDDLNSGFSQSNTALMQFLQFPPDEFKKRTFHDFTYPADLQQDIDNYERLRMGEIDFYQMEKRYIRSDHNVVWGKLTVTSIKDDKGQPEFIITLVDDITQRIVADEQMKLSEARFRSVFENAGIGITIGDNHGNIGRANSRILEMLGYSADEFRHMTMRAITHPDDIPKSFEALKKIRTGEVEQVKFEKRYFHKNGSIVWALTTVSHFATDDEDQFNTIIVIEDITQRKKIEYDLMNMNSDLEQRVRNRTMELEMSNKELESFAYSISHDLRSPLRSMNGWANVLKEDFADQLGEQGHKYLNRICSESVRMANLIDSLLELSRVARIQLNFQEVNLSSIFQEVITDLMEQDSSRHYEVTVAPGIVVNADPTLIRSVVLNLLTNAVKFTLNRQIARVEFGIMKMNSQDVYYVKDNGIGFNMNYVHNLFKPFQRLHNEEYAGSGIGLATIHKIIQRHKGSVWIQSQEDHGTTVFFTLSDPRLISESIIQ